MKKTRNRKPRSEKRGTHKSYSHYNLNEISRLAQGRWKELLVNLRAATINEVSGRGCACPVCGGNDRFSFNDYQGNGICFCRQCDLRSSWKIIQHRLSLSFKEALSLVAEYLGVSRNV
jgi:putative DNA primase/helicase